MDDLVWIVTAFGGLVFFAVLCAICALMSAVELWPAMYRRAKSRIIAWLEWQRVASECRRRRSVESLRQRSELYKRVLPRRIS